MTSQLNVDTIVDKAGSGGTNVKIGNTSTYVSDGGSATQNTVQGLAKSWVGILNKSAVSNGDSLNVSSLTDPGTGRIQITYSNNMNNATYSVTLGEGGNYAYQGKVTSTSQAEHGSVNNSGSYTDSTNGSLTIHGDLA